MAEKDWRHIYLGNAIAESVKKKRITIEVYLESSLCSFHLPSFVLKCENDGLTNGND